ncbi:MAG TPA: leucyl aminopeptidase [Ktedonobacteraceae bacterium]|jgi:leucyl aminopeptidase
MDITLINQALKDVVCDVLIVGAARLAQGEATVQPSCARELDLALDGLITDMYMRDEFKGNVGETVQIYSMGKLAARRVIVTGLGSADKPQHQSLRRASGAAARLAQQAGARHIVLALGESSTQGLQAAVEGALLGVYRFQKYQTEQRTSQHRERMQFVHKSAQETRLQEALKRGTIMAEATNFARDLINEPPAVLTPEEMARRAAIMAQQTGMECTILERPQLAELGMRGLLAVATGSTQAPRCIILRYQGAPHSSRQSLALVGKGVTFDAGGLSLKTAAGMEHMKGDMGGGAAVIGAMQAIASLKPTINVLALVPATENMPDGAAYHPGDILRLMNGKTVEIVNTDAEGRLALADALSYAAQENSSPIIDIATLTGSCHIALGGKRAGLFCNNDQLSAALLQAGESAGERFWPLPLDDEYQENIKSKIADIRQTGGRYGGAINAAKILEHFIGNAMWAHLDIAGTEFVEGEHHFMQHGATGFGVRMLAEFVLKQAEQ